MLIELSELSPTYLEKKSWGNSEVWGRHISFVPKKHIQIVAPSGSGKTSLILFLYGLRKDYRGQIKMDGLDLSKSNIEQISKLRREKISIVFQDLRLFKEQTVRSNIEIKRQLTNFYPPEKITEFLKLLGMEDKVDRLISTCSYGEQQRVAIVRSLMQPFNFLLLDEPLSHLDESNRQKALDLMFIECQARNASMIFADLKYHDFFKDHITYQL